MPIFRLYQSDNNRRCEYIAILRLYQSDTITSKRVSVSGTWSAGHPPRSISSLVPRPHYARKTDATAASAIPLRDTSTQYPTPKPQKPLFRLQKSTLRSINQRADSLGQRQTRFKVMFAKGSPSKAWYCMTSGVDSEAPPAA